MCSLKEQAAFERTAKSILLKEKLEDRMVVQFAFGKTSPNDIATVIKEKKKPKEIIFSDYTEQHITSAIKCLPNKFPENEFIIYTLSNIGIPGTQPITSLKDVLETNYHEVGSREKDLVAA